MIIIYEDNEGSKAVDKEKVNEFLSWAKPLFATGDYEISYNEKNNEFDEFKKKIKLSETEERTMLRQLTADDCIDISPNQNPDWPDAEVYEFVKDYNVRGDNLSIYLKMYLSEDEYGFGDIVVIISFHESEKY